MVTRTASTAGRDPNSRRVTDHARASTAQAKRADGSRAANLLSPNRPGEGHGFEVERRFVEIGGRPLWVGTSHAPLSFISRATSAFRTLVGNDEGRAQDLRNTVTRMATRAKRIPGGDRTNGRSGGTRANNREPSPGVVAVQSN